MLDNLIHRGDVPPLMMHQDVTLYTRKNRTLTRSATEFVQFVIGTDANDAVNEVKNAVDHDPFFRTQALSRFLDSQARLPPVAENLAFEALAAGQSTPLSALNGASPAREARRSPKSCFTWYSLPHMAGEGISGSGGGGA